MYTIEERIRTIIEWEDLLQVAFSYWQKRQTAGLTYPISPVTHGAKFSLLSVGGSNSTEKGEVCLRNDSTYSLACIQFTGSCQLSG